LTVEEEVLQRVKPSEAEQERLDTTVVVLLETIKKLIADRGAKAEPILVGSVAKVTNLKDPDLDLFIRFDPEVPLETMVKQALAIGRKLVEGPVKQYAQHPYIKGRFQGFDTEVVPCYRVEKASAKMSPVDRTPFHTKYIKENMGADLRDEVRLFKAFLKGIGVYGAEVAIEGFSGYLCEILVLKFGGFRQTLGAASAWKRQVKLRMDDGKYPKFDTPLVFMDPVDPARNVASPVSHHSFSLLVHGAKAYQEEPSTNFFFPNPVETLEGPAILGLFAQRRTDVVGLEVPIPLVVEDIYASQVSKAERAIAKLLDEGGFQVVKSGSYIVERPVDKKKGRALLVIETGVKELSAVHAHKGPEVGHPNEKDFLEKWEDHPNRAGKAHIRDKRWMVYIKRDFRSPEELLKARLENLNLGKHLSQEVKESRRVLDVEGLASDFKEQMSEFLDDKFPWER